MKYPACILAGEYARGMTISIAVSSHINQIQDAQTHEIAQEKLNKVLQYAELNTCRKKYLLK